MAVIPRLSVPALAGILLLSCSATPSIGDFTDQVLTPLSRQLGDDIIDHSKTVMIARSRGEAADDAYWSLVRQVPYIKQLFEAQDQDREVRLQQTLAWLETQRLPIKNKLLRILEKRTRSTDRGYSVCILDKERRYEFTQDRWSRLLDGNGQCEGTELQALKEGGR